MTIFRKRLLKGKKGQSIVEYAVILSFVVAAVVLLFSNIGVKGEVSKTFSLTASTLHN